MTNNTLFRVGRISTLLRLALFLPLLLPLSTSAAGILIVVDGRARGEIVVAEEPARMTRLAAEELQTFIEKISGARLPIVTEPSADAVPIYVGMSRYTDELGLTTDGLKYGAFRMDSGKDWLALLGPDRDYEPVEPWGRIRNRQEVARVDRELDEITGNTFRNPFAGHHMYYNEDLKHWQFDDRGTLHAVYELLRNLGVRWYYPGELGEVMPDLSTISFDPDTSVVVEPDFPLRSIKWWSKPWDVREEHALWRLRLGLHFGHDIVGVTQDCHGMKFAHGRAEIRQNHPEWFALISGERDTNLKGYGKPCLSSEEMFEQHVAYARAIFDHFDEPMISIDIVDGYGGSPCGCEDCRHLGTPERGSFGSVSDYVWGYLNRVAEEIYKSHPDKLVSGLAYGGYRYPPTTIDKMSPNLVLTLMTARRDFDNAETRVAFAELISDWQEKLSHDRFFVFENFAYHMDGRTTHVPVYYTRQNAEFLRKLGNNFTGFLTGVYEHRPWLRDEIEWSDLATGHWDLYCQSRLWWDVDTDVEELLDEYCRLFFGPAQQQMRAFIDYSEANHKRMNNDIERIDRALELMAAAKAAVEPDSIYGRRVQLVADYVERMSILRDRLTQPREGPEVVLPRRSAEDLTIDGRLDDVFWQDVPVVELVDQKSGERPPIATTVRMAWADNGSLVIGIHCEEPNMARILDTADGGMGIFNGDNIDIILETPVMNHYQIVISPSGELLDMDRSGQSRHGTFHYGWNSTATVATYQADDYWSVEIQLPAAGADAFDLDADFGIAGDMPIDGAPWYLNIGRLRPRPDAPQFSSLVFAADRRFDNRFIRARLTVD